MYSLYQGGSCYTCYKIPSNRCFPFSIKKVTDAQKNKCVFALLTVRHHMRLCGIQTEVLEKDSHFFFLENDAAEYVYNDEAQSLVFLTPDGFEIGEGCGYNESIEFAYGPR